MRYAPAPECTQRNMFLGREMEKTYGDDEDIILINCTQRNGPQHKSGAQWH
jgi:hypothetical protein